MYSVIISSDFFFFPSFSQSLPSRTPNNLLDLWYYPKGPQNSIHFFPQSFLSSSDWIISIDLFPVALLSSPSTFVISLLLLSISSKLLFQILNFFHSKFPFGFLLYFLFLCWDFPFFSFIVSIFSLTALSIIIAALKSCQFLYLGLIKAGLCWFSFPLRVDHIFPILDMSSNFRSYPRHCKCFTVEGKNVFCLLSIAFSSSFYCCHCFEVFFSAQFKIVLCERVGLLGAYSDIPKLNSGYAF